MSNLEHLVCILQSWCETSSNGLQSTSFDLTVIEYVSGPVRSNPFPHQASSNGLQSTSFNQTVLHHVIGRGRSNPLVCLLHAHTKGGVSLSGACSSLTPSQVQQSVINSFSLNSALTLRSPKLLQQVRQVLNTTWGNK